ncbi:MAG: N-acetylgalactosamine-N,N'-diacetylbacillosaminyl-diphospho-undecaprenol 4-alpha-N-acetylgalactosaminyltransferase [Syntrophomonadaceae bacterium]|nr:N-acetylgalactosamine-N,N'-diacetylbacillosaminyl-diphospho-undecaprenol 4-alpha-N-acetylgalactosaminyltransferase [Bacillota bacterium]
MASIKVSSIKIALFLPSLHVGGAERVLLNLARGFAERGLAVDLVVAKAEGPYLSQVPKEVRIVDLRASRILTSLPALALYLRRERPEVMLSAIDHANIVALWARKLSAAPSRIVVSVHSTLTRATDNEPHVRGRLVPRLVAWFYPWADAVVAVSRGVAEDLAASTGLSAERIKVIHNPVVTPELLKKAKEPLEHPWFASGQPPVILAVGRLTAAKDYPALIKAFKLVRADRPARLMILGEGEGRTGLEALVRELGLEKDVLLLGHVDNPYNYMALAAVFALSSAWEGFGNVLAEAMAVGTPVVSTDCPSGPAEILEGGKWGRLVPAGNPEMLAGAIVASIMDRPDSAGLESRAKDFGLEKISGEYLKVLLPMLSQN